MKLRHCFLSALLCLMLGGCSLDTAGIICGLNIYVDQPLPDTHTPVLLPVAVMGHTIYTDDASQQFQVVIKEQQDVFSSDYDYIPLEKNEISPGLIELIAWWVPQREGLHNILIIGQTDCDYSPVYHIYVEEAGRGGAPEEVPPTPAPTAPPPTAMPLVMLIQFWTDVGEVVAGGCTRLHWNVSHADRIYLDGEQVPASGSREVCPVSTTTYIVRAEDASGTTEKSLAVNVGAAPVTPPLQLTFIPPTIVVQPPVTQQPADTSGPQISSVNHSPASIFDNPACGAAEVQINARVEDPSGVSTVEVYYRVSSGSMQGAWRIVSMTSVGGGEYRAVLGQAQFKSSHPDFFNGTVEYIIKARDTKNNGSESVPAQITVLVCIT